MNLDLPNAVPEIPVGNIDAAVGYYRDSLAFTLDWGDEQGGIAGISKGNCRLFLTNPGFREANGNGPPVVIWLNLGSREEVDKLHGEWSGKSARIVAAPESKPWKLHEFSAADLDGNLLRVFYDFAWETAETS